MIKKTKLQYCRLYVSHELKWTIRNAQMSQPVNNQGVIDHSEIKATSKLNTMKRGLVRDSKTVSIIESIFDLELCSYLPDTSHHSYKDIKNTNLNLKTNSKDFTIKEQKDMLYEQE